MKEMDNIMRNEASDDMKGGRRKQGKKKKLRKQRTGEMNSRVNK